MTNTIKYDSGKDWTFQELDEAYDHIRKIAEEKFGLTYYPNQIEVITSEQMLDSYCATGMPIYYSHWSFGKQFVAEQDAYKRGRMGLAYEIVINSNPCIAYLMEENTMMMQCLVIAHACFGHNSFFRNNVQFKQWTDAEAIIDYLSYAKTYIAECEEKYGFSAVEAVLDAAHALKLQGVDRYKRVRARTKQEEDKRIQDRIAYDQANYNDLWSTIPNVDKNEKTKQPKFPKDPEENLLYFIEKHAPNLDEWKREILRIVSKIAQYFYPQMLTQVMNEGWACVVGDTLVDTPKGLIRADDLVNSQYSGSVDDGKTNQKVVNWFNGNEKDRVCIKLKNGFVLHGGRDHKILVDGQWRELQTILLGEKLPIIRGRNEWSSEYIKLPDWVRPKRMSLDDTCSYYNVHQRTYYKWKNDPESVTLTKSKQCYLVDQYLNDNTNIKIGGTRISITTPTYLSEDLAYWLGLVTGDGGIYEGRYSKVYYVSEDQQLLDEFILKTQQLFGVTPNIRSDRNHWVVTINNSDLVQYLKTTFDVQTGKTAGIKIVPPQILQSPQSVVASFIRGHCDTDGCADKTSGNVILISKSEKLIHIEQQLMLKMGIVSSVSQQNTDGMFRLTVSGNDSILFEQLIGFGLKRKQEILQNVLKAKHWFKVKDDTSAVVEVTFDHGIVYDFSVENTHQYKASCFINHNCFHHKAIIDEMYERGLVTDGFMFEFMQSHTGVIRQQRMALFNPYALGFAMFEDIKRICLEPTEEDIRWFPDFAGNSDWQSVTKFAAYNFKDESFILQYLSPKVMRDFQMFYLLDDDMNPMIYVEAIQNDEGYKLIREKLAEQHNVNNRIPYINVVEVDVWGDRTMILEHYTNKRHLLDPEDTDKTLKHISFLWGYPIILRSVDEAGDKLYEEFKYDPDDTEYEEIDDE